MYDANILHGPTNDGETLYPQGVEWLEFAEVWERLRPQYRRRVFLQTRDFPRVFEWYR